MHTATKNTKDQAEMMIHRDKNNAMVVMLAKMTIPPFVINTILHYASKHYAKKQKKEGKNPSF